jgi:hypothetical protein
MGLVYIDQLLFEINRVVEKENKKNVVFNSFKDYYDINNALLHTENLLKGKITDIPTSYLKKVAKDLGIKNPDQYFEEEKEANIGEILYEVSSLRKRVEVLERKSVK